MRVISGLGGLAVAMLMSGVIWQQDSASADPTSERRYNDIYDVSIGGIKAGEIAIDAALWAEGYRADARAKTAGLIAKFYEASLDATAEGALGEGGFEPAHFSASTRNPKKSQFVEMTFEGGVPGGVNAEPAFTPKPWQIEPTEQTGTADPITAMLSALAPSAAEAACDRRVEVFDGRRRYAVELGAPEIGEESVRCQGTFIRIAGYKPKLMLERPRWEFAVILTAQPDGLHHLDRIVGETPFGAAVVKKRPPKG